MNEFARAIEHLRISRGWNKANMAEKLEMTAAHYSDCVSGVKNFTLKKLKRAEKVTETKLIVVFIPNDYFKK